MVLRYLSGHSHGDPLWTKVLVYALGVLSILEAVFANHQMYQYFILDNGSPERRDISNLCAHISHANPFLRVLTPDPISAVPVGPFLNIIIAVAFQASVLNSYTYV